MNGDSVPDVAFTDPTAGTVSILYTAGAGMDMGPDHTQPFKSMSPLVYSLGAGAAVVQSGLLTGGTAPDLAVLNITDGTVSILANSGMPSYTLTDRMTRTFPGASHYSMALVRSAQPNVADVLVTSTSTDTLNILRNSGTGVLQVDTTAKGSVPTAHGPVFVTSYAGPMGQPSTVLVASSASNQVQRFLDDQGQLSFKSTTTLPTASRPIAIAAGDLDKDGDQDLVIANYGNDTIQILLNDGNGGYATTPMDMTPTGQAPIAVAVADFDQDKCQDIVVAFEQSPHILIYFNVSPVCKPGLPG